MLDFSPLDQLNIPIYICEPDWRVVFRNRSCKRFTSSPRVGGDLRGCFMDGEGVVFPEDSEGLRFEACEFGDRYRTAICLSYRTYAILLFPVILDFDILFGGMCKEDYSEMAESVRVVLDLVLSGGKVDGERQSGIQRMRRVCLSAIENYVALAMFDVEKRAGCTLNQLYGFFCEKLLRRGSVIGGKVKIDIDGLYGDGNQIYADTMYFSYVLLSLFLFALEISDGRDFLIAPVNWGNSVCHSLTFTLEKPELYGKEGNGLSDFARYYPIAYLGVMSAESLCEALGWKLDYRITSKEKLNCTLCFEIENDFSMVVRSAGDATQIPPREMFETIFAMLFYRE